MEADGLYMYKRGDYVAQKKKSDRIAPRTSCERRWIVSAGT